MGIQTYCLAPLTHQGNFVGTTVEIIRIPLKTFLDIGYFLGLSPFTLKLQDHAYFTVHIHKLQLSVAAFLYLGVLYNIVTRVNGRFETPKWRSPTAVFRMLTTCFSFVRRLYTIKVQWVNRKNFANICDGTSACLSHTSGTADIHKYISAYIVVSLIVVIVTFWFGSFTYLSTTEILDFFVETSRDAFYIGHSNRTNTDYHFGDYCLIVLVAMIDTMDHLHMMWSDLLILVTIVTLWTTVMGFVNSLTENGQETVNNWIHFKENLMQLINLSTACNSLIGNLLTFFILETTVDVAKVLFEYDGWSISAAFAMMNESMFIVTKLAIFVIAADVPRRLESCHAWFTKIGKGINKIHQNELNVLMWSLDSHDIAVKASSLFPVTFSMLINVVGVIVTYFLICLVETPPEDPT